MFHRNIWNNLFSCRVTNGIFCFMINSNVSRETFGKISAKSVSRETLINKNCFENMSKFAYANFVLDFGEFKGFALKNPSRGFAPAPHHF